MSARRILCSRVGPAAALGVAFVLGGATFSAVQIAGQHPGVTYHACLLKGVLSKVGGASPTCIKGAKVISWNSTGPQGPREPRAPRVPLAHRDRPVRWCDWRGWPTGIGGYGSCMQATCIPPPPRVSAHRAPGLGLRDQRRHWRVLPHSRRNVDEANTSCCCRRGARRRGSGRSRWTGIATTARLGWRSRRSPCPGRRRTASPLKPSYRPRLDGIGCGGTRIARSALGASGSRIGHLT